MIDDFSKFAHGSTPTTYKVISDGNYSVPNNYSLTAETPSGGPAGIDALALRFTTAAGWKFYDVLISLLIVLKG